MNLAIHDFALLERLHQAGRTREWEARKVVAWMTPGQGLGRPHGRLLQMTVPLKLVEIGQEERPFFLIFQQRLRRGLAQRESVLLFLAALTGSVVLTEEQMVAEAAEEIGLPVCSGEAGAMDRYFPLPTTGEGMNLCGPAAEVADLPPVPGFPAGGPARFPSESLVATLQAIFSPSAAPSSWRVPDRDEPVDPPPAVATRRSKEPCRRVWKTPHNP